MQIHELTAGQPITIQVMIGTELLEFDSNVIESLPLRHGIYATPIMKNDKIVSFKGNNILTHLIVPFEETKPHIFYNVRIQTLRTENNEYYYLISTVGSSREFNRRNAYRCFVGSLSYVQVGLNKATIDATIKDVSLTGFAFVLEKNDDKDFPIGTTVHSVLNDYLDGIMERFSFQLYGIIVRREELENNKIVYGCKFNTKVNGLDRYIITKERLQLNRNRPYR